MPNGVAAYKTQLAKARQRVTAAKSAAQKLATTPRFSQRQLRRGQRGYAPRQASLRRARGLKTRRIAAARPFLAQSKQAQLDAIKSWEAELQLAEQELSSYESQLAASTRSGMARYRRARKRVTESYGKWGPVRSFDSKSGSIGQYQVAPILANGKRTGDYGLFTGETTEKEFPDQLGQAIVKTREMRMSADLWGVLKKAQVLKGERAAPGSKGGGGLKFGSKKYTSLDFVKFYRKATPHKSALILISLVLTIAWPN